MNDLKVFSSTEFGELGVMVIDGKEYFPATQCAKVLGYKEPAKAIREKCKGVSKMDTPTNGGIQAVNYIPEGDLYRLIVSSKLPQAEKFERWVFDEVLPSIRKNGSYGAVDLETIIAKTATAVVSEVMKQIVPLLSRESTHTETTVIETKQEKYIAKSFPFGIPKQVVVDDGNSFKILRRKSSFKIERLSPELRDKVDFMLFYQKMPYQNVVDYLQSEGITISTMSVSRYVRSVLLNDL